MASTAQALAALLDFLEAHGLITRQQIRDRAASDRSEPCDVTPVAHRLADLEVATGVRRDPDRGPRGIAARLDEIEARLDALDGGVEN